MSAAGPIPPPRIVAWEVTRSCPLACRHCRSAARRAPYADELSRGECMKVIDALAALGRPTLILTGGEPLLRTDLFEIIDHAREAGLRVAVATCGALLTDETASRLVASGVGQVSVSVDGSTAETHDAFRGTEGAFDAAVRGVEAARRNGLAVQINTTATRLNRDDLPAILDLSLSLGATCFNPFLLVPTGRAKGLSEQSLSADEYETTLQWLADQQGRPDIEIRVTCAPHYQRILRQRGLAEAGDDRPSGGCLGGKSFVFISHRGVVQICGFLDVACGDLRRERFDLRRIWETSDVLRRVRDVDGYGGACGCCEYRRVCGGCRARAYAATGDYLAEEPLCAYRPEAGDAEAALEEADRRLLAVIQAGFPVAARPFDVLAERLRGEPQAIVDRIGRLKAAGIIRRLGPVFDSRRLAYVSTLVAARVPAERLEDVAAHVSATEGVTHNYERRGTYNLWFTLTARSEEEIEGALGALRRETGIEDFHSLPAETVYKIRVQFDLGEDVGADETAPPPSPAEAPHLDESQKRLVRAIQNGLPLVPEPFAAVAKRAGWATEAVLEQIRSWLGSGVVRRFGAVVAHRRLGFAANGMAVFCLPEGRVDAVGRRLAERPEVTHCYRRRPLADFPYNLYAMVHGGSEARVVALLERLAGEVNLPDWDVLFSVREFKKSPMRYFAEPAAP